MSMRRILGEVKDALDYIVDSVVDQITDDVEEVSVSGEFTITVYDEDGNKKEEVTKDL